eukprot:3587287-Pyramimonas_sp.AAC.1
MQGPDAAQYRSRTTAVLTSSSKSSQQWSAGSVGALSQPGLLFWAGRVGDVVHEDAGVRDGLAQRPAQFVVELEGDARLLGPGA